MIWTAIGALLADDGPDASGWARTDDEGSEHGLVRVIVLKGRKLVREGWRVPTLIIDANLNPDLVRPFWPFYTTTVDLAAPTPHQRTRQVVDRSYSKRHLGRTSASDPVEKRSGHRHLQQLAATLDEAARQAKGRGGRGALICCKQGG